VRFSLPRGESCVVALVEGPGDTWVSPENKPSQLLRQLLHAGVERAKAATGMTRVRLHLPSMGGHVGWAAVDLCLYVINWEVDAELLSRHVELLDSELCGQTQMPLGVRLRRETIGCVDLGSMIGQSNVGFNRGIGTLVLAP
jgi:hypothetical protein